MYIDCSVYTDESTTWGCKPKIHQPLSFQPLFITKRKRKKVKKTQHDAHTILIAKEVVPYYAPVWYGFFFFSQKALLGGLLVLMLKKMDVWHTNQ